MMRVMKFNRGLLVVMTCFATVLPGPLKAAEPSAEKRLAENWKPVDLKLDDRAAFRGQVVDADGRPQSSVAVELWTDGAAIQRTLTDDQGVFEFAGLKTGVYQVMASGSGGVFRVWQSRMAPPAARSEVLLVQGPVVRGQYAHPASGSGVYDGKIMRTLSNPWVFAGVVAAGIAIPVAIAAENHGGGGDGS